VTLHILIDYVGVSKEAGERGVRCVDQTARATSGDLSRHEMGIVDARYFSNKHRFGAVLPESF